MGMLRNRRRRVALLPARAEDGFTVLELAVAIALTAVVFTALAAALGASLKSLTVQKARTQGNEVATLGIEDLQRVGYAALGVCAPAPNPPTGMSSTVFPLNCPNPVPANYGQDPCNATVSGAGIPKAAYSCMRNGVRFDVRRYIAWGDPGQTVKRLAVFVNWRDAQGVHEVSQQSSLRAPGQSDVVGLPPPTFTSVSVTPETTVLNSDGTLPSSATIVLSATTTNMATTDKVFAVFNTLDAGGTPVASSKFLTSTNGANWSATVTPADGWRFGSGSQHVTFSAIRDRDGKSNSAIATPTNKFCAAPDTTCSSNRLPAFEWVTATSSGGGTTVGVTPTGNLVPERINLTARTRNTTGSDFVSATFQTSTGSASVFLQLSTCDTITNVCDWTGSISRSEGYAFPTGSRPVYFSATQVLNPDPLHVDKGNTAAQASGNLTFQLQ